MTKYEWLRVQDREIEDAAKKWDTDHLERMVLSAFQTVENWRMGAPNKTSTLRADQTYFLNMWTILRQRDTKESIA